MFRGWAEGFFALRTYIRFHRVKGASERNQQHDIALHDIRVKRVVINTPDKDLAQRVRGTRVVQLDRRRRLERDEQGVIQKFGVKPSSILDYLALAGDTAAG